MAYILTLMSLTVNSLKYCNKLQCSFLFWLVSMTILLYLKIILTDAPCHKNLIFKIGNCWKAKLELDIGKNLKSFKNM